MCVPGDLLDELAGVRGVKLDAEVERVGVGVEVSLLRLELLANLLTGVEPLLEMPSDFRTNSIKPKADTPGGNCQIKRE